MDIEALANESKSRKGSYSTIPSPGEKMDSLIDGQDLKSFKHKKVRKDKKMRRYSSMSQGSSEEISLEPIQNLVRDNRKRIFLMIREIFELFHLHEDTYLICLKIANILRFDGDPLMCFQVSGTICFLVCKLYECNKLSFSQVNLWSGGHLSK